MKEQAEIKGYLNRKDILHVFTVALGWFISSGILSYLMNNYIPAAFTPLISVLASFLAALYAVLNKLDQGEQIPEHKLEQVIQEQKDDRTKNN